MSAHLLRLQGFVAESLPGLAGLNITIEKLTKVDVGNNDFFQNIP